jgi:anaerobic selenocysteine-containing dehydrogenase
VLTEWLLWALHTITGSWEQPGGPWCNPGYQTRLDERAPRVGSSESPGPASRPDLVGRFGERPCAALNDEIEAGNVRVLVVLGGNPATSLPDAQRFAAATRRLDALVVADVVESDTVRLATHALPVAGQLERTDVTTLVELFSPVVAAQHTPPVLPPGGARRAAWRVFADLAERLGHDVLPAGIDHRRSSDAALLTASRRNPFAPDALRRASVLLSDDPRPRGWIHDTVLAGRRWNLAPPELVRRLAALGDPPPLVFTPRRAPRRMNSALRDVHAPGGKLDPTHVWVHPDDAAAAGVTGATAVTVRSDVGAIVAPLLVTERVRRGTVSVPHGLAAEQNVSRLTSGSEGTVEPLTGMVAQSGVPVTLTAAD